MKNRAAWVFVVLVLLVLGGIYLRRNPTAKPAQAPLTRAPAAPAPAVAQPAPAAHPPSAVPMVQSGRSGPMTPIQDGKTIDMSSGRPVVKDDPASQAALEKGLKEMEEAAKGVTFKPRPAPAAPVDQKKAEPPPAPPKS